MSIGVLYLSHRKFDWNTFDTGKSLFANRKNIHKIQADEQVIDCYSSLEDLEIKHANLLDLYRSCQKIQLVDLDFVKMLIDHDDGSLSLYLSLMTLLKREGHMIDLHPGLYQMQPWSQTPQSRPHSGPCLWINGCSISAGSCVSVEARYANILARMVGMPLVLLAEGGSGINWQFERWMEADVRPGDLLIWGLTNCCREDVIIKGQPRKINARNYQTLPRQSQYWTPEYLDSSTQARTMIKRVIDFESVCARFNIRDLFLINFLDDSWMPLVFADHPKFLDLGRHTKSDGRYDFADYGVDHQHPGPIQHAHYADQIFNFIKTRRSTVPS